MGEDEGNKPDTTCPKPEQPDVELAEGSIRSIEFPVDLRPATDPFSSVADAGTSESPGADSEAPEGSAPDSE